MIVYADGKECGKVFYAGGAVAGGHDAIIRVRDLVHTYSVEDILGGKTISIKSNGGPAKDVPLKTHLTLLLNAASLELGLAVDNIRNMGPRTRAGIRQYIEESLEFAREDYNYAVEDFPRLDPDSDEFIAEDDGSHSFNPAKMIDEVIEAVRSREPKPERVPDAFEFCAMSPKEQKRYTG